MPPAMKVYIHHDEDADAARHTTIKIKLPKKWRDGPVFNLKETFIEHFNKKHPEQPLALADVHVEDSAQTRALADDAVVSKYFKNGDDVYIKTGAPPASTAGGDEDEAGAGAAAGDVKEAAAADGGVLAAAAGGAKGEEKAAGGAAAAAEGKEGGKLRCRNYGCNSHFVEAENGPEACQFHTKPPIFHDTKKGWSCCPKRVYDWDEFQLLVGCERGPHSTQEPGKTFALSPNYSGPGSGAAAAGGSGGGSGGGGGGSGGGGGASGVKDISSWNSSNPEATTAAGSAAKSVAAQKARPAARADGKAKCVNPGCQAEYVVAENGEKSCHYHAGAPVFHDRAKYWSCCPKKAYDFDSFLALPKCVTGLHRDFLE